MWEREQLCLGEVDTCRATGWQHNCLEGFRVSLGGREHTYFLL